MFQTYEDISNPARGKSRVIKLRKELEMRGLDAFFVPRADEHQNEYVPAGAERLAWLTGFTGSAGTAVVTRDRAALFVDGRYTLQAPAQVDAEVFEILQVPENRPSLWLVKRLRKGAQVGYDPRLHTMRAVEQLDKALREAGIALAPQPDNLVDAIWDGRPGAPMGKVALHPLKYAGVPASRKIEQLQRELRKGKAAACVLTLPESIAWLFNIRGSDVPHTPLPLSFAIVPARDRPQLFIAPQKLSNAVRAALERDTQVRAPHELEGALEALGEARARVRLDPETAAQWFADTLTRAGAETVHGADPCLLPKARKNTAEIDGSRAAHRRDGAAMCRFLAWLDANAPSGRVDEIAAVKKLESLRADTGKLRDISFETISGAGPNGAIVHYRVSKASNAQLKPGSLYLVDSGAQYEDGTTDITRTVAIGAPTDQMRRHFTLVLKGHIALASSRFPKGTRGADLDPLARAPLWAAGLDYDHGTGHGVGSYLSVHEGPQRISKLGTVAIEPGMICSNEPGYYRTGYYGIRIENLVLVTKARKIRGGDRPMMGFETLTLAPIDRRLIDEALLTRAELKWLDAYHARVLREIAPALKGGDREWLERAAAPLEAR